MIADTLETVQNLSFDLMCEFDRVCKDAGIQYFLTDGTLLGAARHQNFIPWDDDVDVVIRRKDLQCLIKAFDKQNGRYVLTTPSNRDSFFDFLVRLEDTETEVILRDTKQTANLRMDVFIMDNAPDGISRKINLIKRKIVYAEARGHRKFDNVPEGGKLYALAEKILAAIGRHKDLSQLVNKYTKLSDQFPFTGKVWYTNQVVSYMHVVYEEDLFKETT